MQVLQLSGRLCGLPVLLHAQRYLSLLKSGLAHPALDLRQHVRGAAECSRGQQWLAALERRRWRRRRRRVPALPHWWRQM